MLPLRLLGWTMNDEKGYNKKEGSKTQVRVFLFKS
jgi:hypothetical protein